MDGSYIVESLPSHARHSGGKTLLVHIWPTPDISTYSNEWYHLGGPQQGHHKPCQYQSIIEYSTQCGPLCTLCLAHMQYHMEYGCLGDPQLLDKSELEPNQHTTEPREPALGLQQPAFCLFILAHLPHGMMAHEWSTLVSQIWPTALV